MKAIDRIPTPAALRLPPRPAAPRSAVRIVARPYDWEREAVDGEDFVRAGRCLGCGRPWWRELLREGCTTEGCVGCIDEELRGQAGPS